MDEFNSETDSDYTSYWRDWGAMRRRPVLWWDRHLENPRLLPVVDADKDVSSSLADTNIDAFVAPTSTNGTIHALAIPPLISPTLPPAIEKWLAARRSDDKSPADSDDVAQAGTTPPRKSSTLPPAISKWRAAERSDDKSPADTDGRSYAKATPPLTSSMLPFTPEEWLAARRPTPDEDFIPCIGPIPAYHREDLSPIDFYSPYSVQNYCYEMFISSRGNEYFCEIDEEYLTDRFNLTGLNTEVQYYQYALDLVTDVFDLDCEDDMRETIEKSARHLYGLVHARYIVTTRGLAKMLDKYKKCDFGKCPRVLCDAHPLLPMGTSDLPHLKSVKLYCAKCEDIYNPKSSRHAAIDGAYFGASFHNILFQVYPALIPDKSRRRYEPRIFGFRVHAAAALARWQDNDRETMKKRLRAVGRDGESVEVENVGFIEDGSSEAGEEVEEDELGLAGGHGNGDGDFMEEVQQTAAGV